MNGKNIGREVARLTKDGADSYYPGAPLVDWFQRAGDAELWRINSHVLANTLGVDRTKLLTTFIRLVKDGVVDLNWDFHCTDCNAVAGTHRHLNEATAGDHCPLCNLDFRNTLDRNVEVTFTPTVRLWSMDKRFLAEQTRRHGGAPRQEGHPAPAPLRFRHGLPPRPALSRDL